MKAHRKQKTALENLRTLQEIRGGSRSNSVVKVYSFLSTEKDDIDEYDCDPEDGIDHVATLHWIKAWGASNEKRH